MRTRVRSKRRKYASGKNSFAICDRTGFKHRLRDMVIEPGTGLFVYKGWSDGRWSRVDHPLNFPAPAGEAIGLKNASPDIIPKYIHLVQALVLQYNACRAATCSWA